MFIMSAIFVLISAVAYANAAVAIYPAREKPTEFADQEGCYLEDLQKVIPYGDYYPKDSCSKYACYTSGMIQFVTCGVQLIDKESPCELISDDSRDYPDCCPLVMCHTIPPEDTTSESSSPKTTDIPVVKHLPTSERAEEATDVPLLKYLSNNERINEKTTESASVGTTVLPVVERQATNETAVPGTSDAPTQYRSSNDETINELLIAQASVNTQ